jgi:hypothetical protein
MTRRIWIVAALALSGCGNRAMLPPNLFPETVATVWHRTQVRNIPIMESPDPVPRNEVVQLREAQYEGPGKLAARVYLLTSPGLGLDLVQRWRPSADTVFFYRDRFFVVIKWQNADRMALQRFVNELEKVLSEAGGKS